MSPAGHIDPTDLPRVRTAVGLDRPQSALHDVGLERIVIGRDALDALPGLVRDALLATRAVGRTVAVVTDGHEMYRGGADLASLVAERLDAVAPVRVVRLAAPGLELHADASAIAAAVDAARGAGCLVALGSGTICDIVKEASRELAVPDVTVQTANSVNAFSDDMAVLLIRGVKRTVPSRWPTALVADLTVVADAPAQHNPTGGGELC
jgi:glycerol-1-phosphate dehydrogenase [NAD(P)+]